MNVQDFYNNEYDEATRLSGNDNRHKVELYRKRYLYKRLIQDCRPESDNPSLKIIQIACGTGVHTEWLCENYPNSMIFASDIIPKHIEQLKSYPNLNKRVWDCTDDVIPKEYYVSKPDIVLVEGAWYHLTHDQRKKLLENLNKMRPKIIVIDWLSFFHEVVQQVLRYKKFPDTLCTGGYLRPPFVFDNYKTVKLLENYGYEVSLYPVDMDIRFGYEDFNKMSEDSFEVFMSLMNSFNCDGNGNYLYDAHNAYLMNATEHGCYILRRRIWWI